MTRTIYKAVSAGSQLFWRLGGPCLRILCYHGICEDRLRREAWLPDYFVTASAFERQLQYLREVAAIVRLSDAAAMLKSGSLPPRAVCLTFDDGYANNLHLAQPLLEKYQTPATVLLSSAYIESGEMYPFLRLHLIRKLAAPRHQGLLEYKNNPVDQVLASAAPVWREVESGLTPDQVMTLRPLTVSEVRSANPRVLDFGAHTHTHCILRNESARRRAEEIRLSIRKVEEWTGRRAAHFSYPNGEPGDFGEQDQKLLRELGVECALTGIGGLNGPDADPLALRRLPVGLYHDDGGFRTEMTGLRSHFLNLRRRLRG
ncbi:MAG: polysaccharide deacetylase family protein [Bryobacteraceae bacterium]|nr:polysaccharide deacetylase family protein [Bryobacteraceae bacterium]